MLPSSATDWGAKVSWGRDVRSPFPVVGREELPFLLLLFPVVGRDLFPPSFGVVSGTTLFRSLPLTARVTLVSFSVKDLDMDRPEARRQQNRYVCDTAENLLQHAYEAHRLV
jgi:hypothetical protein